MYFENVIGQDTIKSHLLELLEKERLPHSLLFYGESGLGKLDMAIGLASTLLGRQVFAGPQGQDYLDGVKEIRLNRGESEKKIEEEGLPIYQDGGDAFWIRPMKKTLRVEQWYQLLRDHLQVAGTGRRVVIVEDFHKANAVMANAMLKTIEEPPAGVSFIILTDTIHTVLPTIISRCMCIAFQPVPNETIRRALEAEGLAVTDQALAAGQGNPSLVRELAQQGSIESLELAVKVMKALAFEPHCFALISLYTENLDRDQVMEVCHWMRLLGRDLLALRFGAGDRDLRCPLHKGALMKMLPRWSTQTIALLVKESLGAERALRLHLKASLVVDGLIIRLQEALKEV